MATPFRLKRSSVQGKRPALTDLQTGELALNTNDGFLFATRDTGGVGIGTTVTLLTPWTENFGGGSIFYANSVGIGTTNPTRTLTVIGTGASLSQLFVTGVSTFVGVATFPNNNVFINNSLFVGGVQINGGASIGTDVTTRNLNVSGIGTIATLGVTGVTTTQHLNVIGVSTLGFATATQLFVSGVTTSTGGFVGNLTGIAASATKLVTPRTFEITGDVVASPIFFDGTGNVSLAATIQPNSVGLGTDTTGDYVQTITGTANQITVTGGTGESSTPTLSIPNQFTVPQDLTVIRDVQINRNLNVNGNITIGGTSATLFTTELKISDPDLILGFRTDALGNDISNDTTANHGGIAIASTEGSPLVNLFIAGIETTPATYKKFMWFKAGEFSGLGTDAWLSNYAIGIGSTQFPTGTRLAAGNVQFTQNDLAVVRNINASGIITATTFVGQVNAGVGTITTLSGTNATYTNGNLTTLNATNGNIVTGIVTTISGTNLTYTTGNLTTGNIVTGVVTSISGTNLNYTGVGTITTLNSTTGTITNLTSTGISGTIGTITTLNSTTGTITNLSGTIGTITNLTSTGISGTIGTITTLNSTIGTITNLSGTIGTITNLNATQLNVSGVITATNGIQGIGIQSGSINIATGIITALNFVGSGNTFSYNSTTKTVDINIGGSQWSFTDTSNTLTSNIFRLNGNVGLGTTNPTSKLHVVGDTLITGFTTLGTGATTTSTLFTNQLSVAGVSTHIGISTFQSTLFTNQLSVAGVSTYIGVATFLSTLFTNQLNVSGVSTFTGISTFQSTLFTNQLNVSGVSTFNNNILQPSGSIGIATTNPTSKLHVVGDALITGVLTAVNGIRGIGIQSGSTSITTGIITTLNFVGSAVSTVTNTNGLVEINVKGSEFTKSVTSIASTAGQTSFPVTYTPNFIDVFLNGVRLTSSEFTATNGTSVVLNEGANDGDTLDVVVFQNSGLFDGSKWIAKTPGTPFSGDIYRINGNIGIGTTNPQAKLHVIGNTIFTGVGVATTSVNSVLQLGKTNIYYVGVTSLTLPPSPSVGDRLEIINRSGITTAILLNNGSAIMGVVDDMQLDVVDGAFTLTYSNVTDGWVVGR